LPPNKTRELGPTGRRIRRWVTCGSSGHRSHCYQKLCDVIPCQRKILGEWLHRSLAPVSLTGWQQLNNSTRIATRSTCRWIMRLKCPQYRRLMLGVALTGPRRRALLEPRRGLCLTHSPCEAYRRTLLANHKFTAFFCRTRCCVYETLSKSCTKQLKIPLEPASQRAKASFYHRWHSGLRSRTRWCHIQRSLNPP